MGRPEKEIEETTPPYRAQLAAILREQRAATKRTYADLARQSNLSAATLKRAASGTLVPRFETVVEFCATCRPYLPREQHIAVWKETRAAWRMARREERGTLKIQSLGVEFVADYRDFSQALTIFWEEKGALPLRTVQKYSQDPINLPVSSLALILSRKALPQTKRQLAAIIRGCHGSQLEQKKWEAAWDKVFSGRGRYRTIP